MGYLEGAVLSACENFVAMKYRIDDFLDTMWQRFGDLEAVSSYGLDWLTAVGQDAALDDRKWLTTKYPKFYALNVKDYSLRYSVEPAEFVETAVPAMSLGSYSSSDLQLVDIEPRLAIGGCYYRNWPGEAYLDRINQDVSRSDCVYVSPGTLPMYIGHEGKNRIRFFMNSGRKLRAWHCRVRFSEAEALLLHRVEDPCYLSKPPLYVLADLATGKRHVLPLPSITIPLLESYGIPSGSSLSRGSDGSWAWQWQESQRRALYRLASNFMRP